MRVKMERKLLHMRSDEGKRTFVANDSICRASGGGNLHFSKPVEASKVPFYHGSFSCHATEEESLRQGLNKTGGISIKKLLAEEMSSKMETRRRPPSVIAKLMGLDPLPPQQPNHKQHKRFSDNYLHRKSSVNLIEKQSCYEGRSRRMSNKEPQEFKDVFEVETSKTETHVCSSVQYEPANSKLSEAKMEYIRQKFMDVKRLSTDEKLQHSKEFHDALDVLDSNKDLLLKFLQEPDSLFTKHVHDLKGFQPSPQTGHITILKSSNGHNYVDKDVCTKPEGRKDWKNVAGSVHQYENGLVSHPLKKHGAHVSSKVTKSQPYERDDTHLLPVPKPHLYERDDARLLPTRIVVLKPNLRKACNTAMPASSPCSSTDFHSGYGKQEYQSSENLELFAEVRERRNSSIELELTKHRDRGSREIAREITRQMRRTVNYDSVKISNSRLRGYAGDESSCTMSGDDSENEYFMMTPSRRFFDRHSPSSSYSTESSVSREAKKRLSERWKLTHRSQESRTLGRGSTLAEMLAMPDRENRSMTSDPLVGQDNFRDRQVRKDGAVRWAAPLGISSKDGWKDECSRSLPRSRSLPASSTVFGSPTRSIRHESLSNNKRSMLKEAVIHGSNKLKKGGLNQRDGLLLKSNTKASHRKSYSVSYPGELDNHFVKENHLKLDEPLASLEEKNLSEQKPMSLEVCGDGVEERMRVTDEIEVSRVKDVEMSIEMHEDQLCEKAACATSMKDGDFSVHDPDGSNPEGKSSGPFGESPFPSNCDSTEAESPASSKEVEQPSPLSVLERPFAEDISSSSDSFERVSADLHELRMQLQLLKLESSDSYSEGHELIVSSDDDTGEGSVGVSKEEVLGMLQNEEKRDFSYLVDVLRESGFLNTDPDVIMTMWYSPELPMSLSICEKLEKKYGEQVPWLKSERRLLFDRINSGLMNIFQYHMDPHPWVKKENVALGWRQEPLEEKVWNFLDRDGVVGRKDLFEVASRKETKWLDLGDDVDAVGREVERLLFNELVDEILSL